MDAIANKVIEKLNISAINAVNDSDGAAYTSGPSPASDGPGQVFFASNGFQFRGRGGNYAMSGRGQWNNRSRGRGRGQSQRGNRNCRGCGRGGHFVRQCPERYCQACGNKGHDQHNASCPNYHN